MHQMHRLKSAVTNKIVHQKIQGIAPGNIYARTYASYHAEAKRNQSDLRDASRALTANVDRLIQREEHFYDLVVLDKQGPHIRVRDRRGDEHELLDLVSNSYNDLDHVPETREQLARFVTDRPLSSCISRKISGLHTVHEELMREVADFMGYERCVLGTCGYITQISTVFALMGPGDVIFSDRHNHSSIVDGCSLSKAKVIVFRHCDYEHLEELLLQHRKHFNGAAIVSDGVFSTKGAAANIDRIVQAARRHRCISIIDDTHGVTVVGRKGRGCADLFAERPDVITGGFGKAFGAFGGFCVASRELATAIDLNGRQNVNTSHMSPIMAAQALYNLRWYREHQAELQGELLRKVRLFNQLLTDQGRPCYADAEHYVHPIFCLYQKEEKATLANFRALVADGFLPSFFPPPVAEFPSLRFSFHRLIPEAEIRRLGAALARMDVKADPGNLR